MTRWIHALALSLSALIGVGCGELTPGPRAPEGAMVSGAAGPPVAFDIPTPAAPPPKPPRLLPVGADLSSAPVRVWYVERTPGMVDAVYVIGHANACCCAMASEALHRASRALGPKAWSTFGFSWLRSEGEAGAQRALATTVASFDELSTGAQCGGTCKSQVIVKKLDADAVESASKATAARADKGLRLARGVGQPVMLWDDFGAAPQLLFATRQGAPLEIKLSRATLAIPPNLESNTSIGRDRAIRQLEAALEEIDKAKRMASALRDVGTSIPGRLNRFPGPWPALKQTGISSLHEAIRVLEAWARYEQIVKGTPSPELLTGLAELRECLADTMSPHPVRVCTVDFVKRTTFVDTASTLDPTIALEPMLAKQLDQVRSLPVDSPANALRAVTDAFLRGWSATYADPGLETAFDTWLTGHQARVWAEIERAAPGARAAFLRSNVVFDVSESAGTLTIRPLFVLTGEGATVIDPRSGIVRFETAGAHQNLP